MISSAYGVQLDSRILDRILCIVDKITTNCFIAPLINRYNDRLLRHFLLIPERIERFIDLGANCHTSRFSQSKCDFIKNWWFGSFCFSIAISYSKTLGSGPRVSAVCFYFCLTALTHAHSIADRDGSST